MSRLVRTMELVAGLFFAMFIEPAVAVLKFQHFPPASTRSSLFDAEVTMGVSPPLHFFVGQAWSGLFGSAG